jgi:carboxylate-amine ligase
MDIQECPAADIAALTLVIETIKALSGNLFIDLEGQMKWKTEVLAQLLDQTIDNAQSTVIDNVEYLGLFGFPEKKALASELWQHILQRLLKAGNSELEKAGKELGVILKEGTLAHRIVQAIGQDRSVENITTVYRRLCDCLSQNKMFVN